MCEDEVGGQKNKKRKNGVIWLCKRWKNKNQVYATSDKCKVAGRKKSERRIFGIRRHHVCENKHENSSNINMNILQQGFKANL